MPQSYDVIWAKIAADDLLSIIEYIANDSPSIAEKILDEIEKRAASLKRFPKRGSIVPELHAQGLMNYRQLIIKKWRIVYRVSEKSVVVVGVFDCRRDLHDILLERFLR